MAFYEEVKERSLVQPTLGELMKGRYSVDTTDDTIIDSKFLQHIGFDAPWIWSGSDPNRICALWLDIYFKNYGFISRNCYNCWKIVVRMDHFDNLMTIHKLQIEMNKEDPIKFHGKCGVETRPWATYKGRYAAFWYTDLLGGLGKARKLVKEVQKRVREVLPGQKVILKRACTEMEEKYGSSDQWEYPEWHHEKENKLDALYKINRRGHQPDWMKEIILGRWIEHAFRTGDPDAEGLVDKFPEGFNVQPTVDYNNSKDFMLKQVKRGKINDLDKRENKEAKQSKILSL